MFSRVAAKRHVASNGRRDPEHDFGTNPCSEIILRPYQFCNLSEVVVRATDTLTDLRRKVRLATILGTIQATYTHFPYLRKIWQKNTEEERLLGVSLTGIMDHEILNGKNFMGDLENVLKVLKQEAIDTNKIWAEKLGIPVSAAITCVKPSGTVSQLVDAASGIHARHSQYYIRTVRGDNKDPLTQFMKEQGIPNEPDLMKPESTTVFSFPVKSPEVCVTRDDMTALQQLELWKIYALHWCEHKPSITVSVRKDEWVEVGAWLYRNFDIASGLSFLPHSDHIYNQAPYQDCTKEQYEEMLAKMPKSVQWEKLSEWELEDTTKSSQTMACVSGVCEIVDLT
jgi:ribonucleoside-diphosphate reductase alpha chain